MTCSGWLSSRAASNDRGGYDPGPRRAGQPVLEPAPSGVELSPSQEPPLALDAAAARRLMRIWEDAVLELTLKARTAGVLVVTGPSSANPAVLVTAGGAVGAALSSFHLGSLSGAGAALAVLF